MAYQITRYGMLANETFAGVCMYNFSGIKLRQFVDLFVLCCFFSRRVKFVIIKQMKKPKLCITQ